MVTPLVPVNKNSLLATIILLLPTFAKVTDSFKNNLTLILSPVVNAPLLSIISLLIRQALFFRGSGAPESINKVEFLPKISTSRKFCVSPLKVSLT
ncbi:secreted protein [Bathymodiolus azoricus thioautotrophic gill symbiont]|uniref:Secreted protein n=1 Tax=Bathymodiolus azoricus thioautotrophic gill symbiont TaxID=235205 RepID=A0A1H6KLR1_9GAMM|nr:secreted protein [Bathymodiolus azoricus thioautotrophic gill symbiont]